MNTTIHVDELAEPAVNANALSAEDYAALKRAIEHDGFLQPILVRHSRTGTVVESPGPHYIIVDGVHRVRAARELGMREVPCVVSAIDEDTASRIAIGMNKLRGSLNVTTVAGILSELHADGVPVDVLALTGYSEDEVARLIKSTEPQDEDKLLTGANVDLDELAEETPERVERPFVLELKFADARTLRAVKRALRKASGTAKDYTAGILRVLDIEVQS